MTRGIQELEELDAAFGALSHRTRRAILIRLQVNGGTMTSGEIARGMENTWQTTSRHLGVLQHAGLLEVTQKGRGHVYTLQADRMNTLLTTWLTRFAATSAGP